MSRTTRREAHDPDVPDRVLGELEELRRAHAVAERQAEETAAWRWRRAVWHSGNLGQFTNPPIIG